MNKFIVFLIIITTGFCFSQDGIEPISVNPFLYSAKEHLVQKGLQDPTIDSTFIYSSDTINLPFFDEFTKNNFQKYDAGFNDPNVTSELYHRLITNPAGVPLADTTRLTTEKTARYEYNVAQDTTFIFYFDSTEFQFGDLSSYPVDYTVTYGYPRYVVYDTIDGFGNVSDTVWLPEPEFCQDSARQFFAAISDTMALWLDDFAYHNYTLATNPWSLGVVSFDGVDETGYPYFINSNQVGLADQLTSKPINMGAAQPSDSVYFSFVYQTGGFGDAPEAGDSLILEFYSPVDAAWYRVWSANGTSAVDFTPVHFSVVDTKYFADGFQFRFRNYGALSGFLDHFHIDYVTLKQFSGYQEHLFKDFAFVYPISTLLKDYTAVPWDHFRNNPAGHMSDNLEIVVRNGDNLPANFQDGQLDVYLDQVLEGSFNFPGSILANDPLNYAPVAIQYSYHDLSGGYEFDETLPNDTTATFDFVATASAQYTSNPFNDSTIGQQKFDNFYSYDDGSAEKAYGPTGTQSLLAYKFEAYEADSIVGLMMQFVPTVNDVSNNLFLLSVWSDNNGQPGTLLYEDEFFNPRQPKYSDERNKFEMYYFKDTIKVAVDQNFFVGWRQIDADRLGIGMDMNIDNSDKIFYSVNAGASWLNTTIQGSMLMRPVFSTKLDYQLSVEENTILEVKLFPNPANNIFTVKTSKKLPLYITDINGRVVGQDYTNTSISVFDYNSGVYFVTVVDQETNTKITKKLIVQ